ncbi:HD domain-containing protein [Streptomyces sulphureus]|uniref:HD domain-containing protein n=1 Tax=Streptomyces sulphureus TaxID=47758 RepID=UPI000361E945|nr:hypothetical protein [Streptomyces sulphureus]
MSSTEPEDDAVPQPTDDLLAAWTALLISARGGTAHPDPTPYGADLLQRWSEPQRHYHSTTHLRTVLDQVALLAPEDPRREGSPFDRDTVLLAAWFHDAVYRPDRSENEDRSARLAERALPEAGVDASRTAEVARLVRLTTSHAPSPDDAAGAVLCDADLSVLAGPPEAYARYAAQIRQEYSFVPEAVFRTARSEVLAQLLALPRVFSTPYGAEHWEEAARHNVQTELDLLAA